MSGSTFAPLRYPGFRLLWLGQGAHALALWMENIARPLLVLEITGNDAAQLGAVIAVRTLPSLLLGLWAGVVADWFDRKTVLLAAKSASFAVSLIFAVLLVGGYLELWHIYTLVFLRGASQAFDQPARASLVPSVVPGDMVTGAMALLSSTQNFMRILGAAGAGASVALIGLDGTFVAIAGLYVGAVLSTWLLDVESHERPRERGARAMLSGMAEGLRFSKRRGEVRGVLLVALVHFSFGMVYMQVFAPLFAVEVLHIGRGGLGLMLACTGAGALVAALLIARNPPSRVGLILPLGVSGFGTALIAFSLSTYLPGPFAVPVALSLITVVGAFQTSFMALSRSLLVQASPAELRGRVLSLISLDRAAMSGGAAAGGFLAAAIGVQVAQVLFGAVCVLGGITVLWLTPGLRRFRAEAIRIQGMEGQAEKAASVAGVKAQGG